MIVIAALCGYLIGSVPTAQWLGRRAGVDLRQEGTGNPGANNALRTGGPALAAAVLLVEMAKGAGAVLIGAQLAADGGALSAGLGAVAGNVYNVWYRFGGGKGLGITAGVLLAAWPMVLGPTLALMGLTAWLTWSSGAATLITVVALVIAAVGWIVLDGPVAWGISELPLLLVLAAGAGAMIMPRHWPDVSFRRRRPL